MRRVDYRILAGAVLILGGILMLLDQMNILRGAFGLFWACLLAVGAVVCLSWFFSLRSRWWAAIPGFTLAGMSASSLLFNHIGWGGLAFLGGMGVGFWAVILSDRRRWWAIIPGGILVTLGVSAALTNAMNVVNTGGVFFAGLGLTFLLVGLVARKSWAYIPAAVLLLMGILVPTPLPGVWQSAWIGLLLISGAVLIIVSILPRK